MSDYTKYTKQEMQAYAIAKNIKENQIVIVGTGLPLIGASLAKRAVCPSCHPIVESGLMDCSPVEVPRSVGDNRFMAHCAVQWPNIRFIGFEANEWLHDEDRLVAFIGGAQIDPYGNVNSTCIYGKGDYVKPQTRFTGSGGANGIATYCNTIIMMQHQKRRFMEKIDYITSCGWMDGPGGREKVGLPGNRGPQMVVTDLGIMKFDEETKRMYLAYYYPFSSPEMVQENTGFEVDVSRAELMELTLQEPEIIKQSGKYGIRLKASAPSIHLMKTQITTEVTPIVGSEQQSEELVSYLLNEFEEDPTKIWESNIFGKSLNELVNEGLHNKLYRMPEDARMKLKETIERIINDGCNGLICIII